MLRVFLRGAYNGYNFGDDALVAATLYFFEKVLKLDNLTVYLTEGSGSFQKLGFHSKAQVRTGPDLESMLKRLNNILRQRKIPRVLRLLLLCFCLLSLTLEILLFKVGGFAIIHKKYINFYRSLHVIHYIGGGYFFDRWKLKLVIELLNLVIAKMINPRISVIGTGLGIGPIHSHFYALLFRVFLRFFAFISVRDLYSGDTLAKFLPRSSIKCYGDDVVLLWPLMKETIDTRSRNVLAINLKDFPDHNYDCDILKAICDIARKAREAGFAIHYFCFGEYPGPDDHKLLEKSPDLKEMIEEIHLPYEEGFDRFVKNLAKARFGIGFAYHFGVMLTLLSTPSVIIFQGEYYKQKIKGVLGRVFGHSLIIDAISFRNKSLKIWDNLLNISACWDQSHLFQKLYEEMALSYKAVYQNLLNRFRLQEKL